MTNDDSPMLGLRDSAGVDLAIVGIQNDYPIMVLNGRGGNEQAAFAVAPDESAFLRFAAPMVRAPSRGHGFSSSCVAP